MVARRLVASGRITQGQGTVTIDDAYFTHIEAVELDLATKSGATVVLGGRVTVCEPSRTIFVEVVYSSTLSRLEASSALLGALEDGRIGSDVVRAAVERGFTLLGYGVES